MSKSNTLQFMTYEDMEKYGHDVHEICYQYDTENPIHWQRNSIYLTDEAMNMLCPYIDKVITEFAYYGPQKITVGEWESIKALFMKDHFDSDPFFDEIDKWLKKSPYTSSHFWILGM